MNLGGKLEELMKAKKGGGATTSAIDMDKFVLAFATQKPHELLKIEGRCYETIINARNCPNCRSRLKERTFATLYTIISSIDRTCDFSKGSIFFVGKKPIRFSLDDVKYGQ